MQVNDTELMISWRETLTVIDTVTEKLCINVFNDIKKHIIEKILSAAGRNARLNGYDEKVYDYYNHLMRYYESVVGLYDENAWAIQTPVIKDIVAGIYEVVSLQLKQFMESQQEPAVNPVTQEKKDILLKCINLFSTSYDTRREDFFNQNLWEGIIDGRQKMLGYFGPREAADLLEQLTAMIQDNCYDSFYSDYRDAVAFCYDELNDLHSLESISFYYELLRKESDILGSIITIQVTALESETEKPQIEAGEKALVQNILTTLREGYQYYSHEATEVINGFFNAKTTEHIMSLENYETFVSSLKAFIHTKKEQHPLINLLENSKVLYHVKLSRFKLKLYEESAGLFDMSQFFNKSIYDFQKNISEQVLMAGEMVQVFQRQIDFFKSMDFSEELRCTPDFEIMKGIFETIEIKIESLNDNTIAFTEECNEVIDQMVNQAKNGFHLPHEDMDENMELLCEKWKERFTDIKEEEPDKNDISDFINQCLADEPFSSYRQRAEKIQAQYKDMIEKKINSFKKDIILYEISTYEEINNYSVSRLLVSENESVVAFVDIMSELTDAISMILNKNNVVIIKPAPHDLFNGKEHEVLMAENNQEFKKGEIIKLMNSGYKQFDMVILRANVIAAK